MFKILPDTVIDWRDVWFGAAMMAMLFIAGRYLIAVYPTYTAPESTYSAAGSLVLFSAVGLLFLSHSVLRRAPHKGARACVGEAYCPRRYGGSRPGVLVEE